MAVPCMRHFVALNVEYGLGEAAIGVHAKKAWLMMRLLLYLV